MRSKLLLSVAVALSLSPAQNLLVNGDFEQALSVGWVKTGDGRGTHTCNRDTSYHPDPDYEAMAYQYDNPGFARLGQTVDVPGIQLHLSFSASFKLQEGTYICWPAACFSVCYLDSRNTSLGETRYYYSTYADWVPSPTLSLKRITSPDWTRYDLDVADELTHNLPGVNPADVARVEVSLYAYTRGI